MVTAKPYMPQGIVFMSQGGGGLNNRDYYHRKIDIFDIEIFYITQHLA